MPSTGSEYSQVDRSGEAFPPSPPPWGPGSCADACRVSPCLLNPQEGLSPCHLLTVKVIRMKNVRQADTGEYLPWFLGPAWTKSLATHVCVWFCCVYVFCSVFQNLRFRCFPGLSLLSALSLCLSPSESSAFLSVLSPKGISPFRIPQNGIHFEGH